MSHADALKKLRPQERHAYKAQVLADLSRSSYEVRPGTVVTVLEMSLEHDHLRLILALTVDNVPVALNNPFHVHNPPLSVPDPHDRRQSREDPVAALRDIVIAAVGNVWPR